jgi:hypothetical protein
MRGFVLANEIPSPNARAAITVRRSCVLVRSQLKYAADIPQRRISLEEEEYVLISFDNAEDALKVKDHILSELPANSIILSPGSRGFSGSVASDLLILATTISPLIIRKLADVLSQIVAAKAQRQVSINGIDLKGYDAPDVLKVLETAVRLEQPGESAH